MNLYMLGLRQSQKRFEQFHECCFVDATINQSDPCQQIRVNLECFAQPCKMTPLKFVVTQNEFFIFDLGQERQSKFSKMSTRLYLGDFRCWLELINRAVEVVDI